MQPGDVIFDIGDRAEYFYFLHQGTVRYDCMFEVEHIAKWPCRRDQNSWNIQTSSVIRSLNHTEAPALIGHVAVVLGQ